MSLQTIQRILYDQTWALLEVAGSYVVLNTQPGNRLKLTKEGALTPEKQQHQAADYPELALDYGDFTYGGWTGPKVARYAFKAGGQFPGVPGELIQNLALTVTFGDMRSATSDPLIINIIDQLDAGGPGYGLVPSVLKYCQRGDIRGSHAYGRAAGQPSIVGTRYVLTWPVTARWTGAIPTRTV
jgi:hypothetical protein